VVRREGGKLVYPPPPPTPKKEKPKKASWPVAVFAFSLPVFVVDIVLAYVFALQFRVVMPVQGYTRCPRLGLAANLRLPPSHSSASTRADRTQYPGLDA